MAFISDQYFYSDVTSQSNDWLDFDRLLNFQTDCGDDHLASANSVSPELSLPYDAEMVNDLPDLQSAFSDMINYDLPQANLLADGSPIVGLMPDPASAFDQVAYQNYQPYDMQFDFRQMVEAQAVTTPGNASLKEKRREAAIALHLQRLCDATALDLDMSSDSNTSFSSPSWSDYMQESISSHSTSASPEPRPTSPSTSGNGAGAGAMEMVLDLNMNATTNVPKKQKPRSQAQKENYIKARKYGACEKHKKQHKRCNCLEMAATRAETTQLPTNVGITGGLKERSKHPSIHMPISSDARSTAVPGLDSSLKSPLARPLKSPLDRSVNVVKKVVSSSLEASVVSHSAGMKRQPLRETTQTTQDNTGQQKVPSTTAVNSPVKNASINVGKNIFNSPVKEIQSSVQLSQAAKPARKSTGLSSLRWRSLKEPSNSQADALQRSVAALDSKKHSPGATNTVVLRTPDIQSGSLRTASVLAPARLKISTTAVFSLAEASLKVRSGLSSTATVRSSTSVFSDLNQASTLLSSNSQRSRVTLPSAPELSIKDCRTLCTRKLSGADHLASSLVQSTSGLLAQ
ncbi:hypothetical protein N7495_008589, partial [Penicillium taxi]|uniref:uncharacterized protein n=1 Tax=Penicillium taxi TaxID=168475 RepID=UPI002545502B